MHYRNDPLQPGWHVFAPWLAPDGRAAPRLVRRVAMPDPIPGATDPDLPLAAVIPLARDVIERVHRGCTLWWAEIQRQVHEQRRRDRRAITGSPGGQVSDPFTCSGMTELAAMEVDDAFVALHPAHAEAAARREGGPGCGRSSSAR